MIFAYFYYQTQFMGFFDHSLETTVKIQAEIIQSMHREEIWLIKELFKHTKCKPNPVHLVLTTSINNSKFIIMNLSLKENEFSLAAIALLDSVTQKVIPDAVLTNVVAASDDATVAIGSFVPKGTVFSKDVLLPDGSTLTSGLPTPADYVTAAGVQGAPDEPPTRNCNIVTKADAAWTNNLGEAQTGSVVVTIAVTVVTVATADGVELQLTFGPAQLQFS
jgi:hypothetical protein